VPQAVWLWPLECDGLTSKVIQKANFSKVLELRCSANG
jgi:hypothetical protein